MSSDEFVTILEKKISKRKRAQSVDLTTVVCDEDNDDVTILHEHNMTRVPSKRKKRRIVIDLANNKDDMNGIISIVQVIPPPDPLIVAKALENAARRDRVPNPCFRAHKSKFYFIPDLLQFM